MIDFTQEFESASTGQKFPTEKDAFLWAKTRADERGFHIIWSSKKLRGYGRCDHYFTCDCASRKSKPEAVSVKKLRQTASKRIGCMFQGVVKIDVDGQFYIKITEGRHNHELSYYKEGHSSSTRLNDDDKIKIAEMAKAQCKPKVILNALRHANGNSTYVKKSVSNYMQKLKKEKSSGRNPARQFLYLARKENYVTRILPKRGSRGSRGSQKMRAMFWSHPDSRSLLRTFPNVILIDATYSTNRYHYALVEFIGVTPTNQNFVAAQALLENEDKASYSWTLECLKQLLGSGVCPNAIVTDRELGLLQPITNVFPGSHHILCMFHIMKMIKTRAVLILNNEKAANKLLWGEVRKMIDSSTVEEYQENEKAWRTSCSEWLPEFVKYMDETWLPHKEKFVCAWTNKVMHYGNTTTNRVESAHSSLKTWIRSARGGLDTLFEQSHAEIEGQVTEIKRMLEWSRTKSLDGYDIAPYMFLLRQASHYSLKLLVGEYMKKGICTHAFPTSHGLPCRCQLHYLGDDSYIDPECIDEFWTSLRYGDNEMPMAPNPYDLDKLMMDLRGRDAADQLRIAQVIRFEMYPEEFPYQEPLAKEKKRGRPSQKKRNSTRKPSHWEHVAKKFGAKTSRNSKVEKPKHAGTWNVPPYIRPYLTSIDDVKGDGNCGFRVAALAVYNSEEQYRTVRQNMYNEIASHRAAYLRIYHTETELDNALHRINWTGGLCDSTHWMCTPDDLFAMAQVFRAVVSTYMYSKDDIGLGGSTVFPWRGEVHEFNSLPEISIIYRHEEEHYVLGHFRDIDTDVNDHPLPLLHPLWKYMRNRSLRCWEEQYGERLDRYMALQQAFRRQFSGKRRI